MTQNAEPDAQPSAGPPGPADVSERNRMDRPVPGSDGPVPNATASGLAEPIEAAEQAGGVPASPPAPGEQLPGRTSEQQRENRPS